MHHADLRLRALLLLTLALSGFFAYHEGPGILAWHNLGDPEQHVVAAQALGEHWASSWIAHWRVREILESGAFADYDPIIEGMKRAGADTRGLLEKTVRSGTAMERFAARQTLEELHVPVRELAPLYLDVLPDIARFFHAPELRKHGHWLLSTLESMLATFRLPDAAGVGKQALSGPDPARRECATRVFQYLCHRNRVLLAGAPQTRGAPNASPPPGSSRLEWYRELNRGGAVSDHCPLQAGATEAYAAEGDRVNCSVHRDALDADPYFH